MAEVVFIYNECSGESTAELQTRMDREVQTSTRKAAGSIRKDQKELYNKQEQS